MSNCYNNFLNILAALVEGTIFCMHGGLSPDLVELDQVNFPLHLPPCTKSERFNRKAGTVWFNHIRRNGFYQKDKVAK